MKDVLTVSEVVKGIIPAAQAADTLEQNHHEYDWQSKEIKWQHTSNKG
jgi:hypothetical protein